MAFGLTDDGFTPKRAADVRDSLRDRIVAELASRGLPTDVSFASDTVAGIVTDALAVELGLLWDAAQAVYDGTDPNNAAGLSLDNVGALRGIPRQAATFSTVDLTVTGTAGVVVPSGSLVEGGGIGGDAQWQTTEDVTLTGGSDTVAAQATQRGSILASIADIDTIRTPISGWDTVTNGTAATPGQDREQDGDYAARQEAAPFVAGGRSVGSLQAAVLAVDGVSACTILNNTTSSATTIAGKTVEAHSILPIVFPISLSSTAQEAIVQALFDGSAGGIQIGNGASANDVNLDVEGDGFDAVNIGFDYASDVTCDLVTTVVLAPGVVLGDVETGVQLAVQAYMESLTVGEDVYDGRIIAAAISVDGVVNATATVNGGSSQVINEAEFGLPGINTVTT